jgi:nitrate/TMAO reductase-like tetraheme cytochrome c subunit
MDKKMEQGLQQMMERLFARHTEEMNSKIQAGQAEHTASQEKTTSKIDTGQKEIKASQEMAEANLKGFKEDKNGHMKACLEGLRPCGEKTTA